MIVDFRRVEPEAGRQAFNATWLISVPWAHPFWSQYVVALLDLTTPIGKAPVLARPGMTHELLIFAIDPDGGPQTKLTDKWPPILTPANHAYQFAAWNDDMAQKRIEVLLDRIAQQQLSPDTDFTPVWNVIFADGASLKTNMLERAFATVQ